MSDRLLVLVRHGQSDWNLKNLFTGWKDPDLTEQGIAEAKTAGRKLKEQGLSFDLAFTSDLTRAQHTLKLMLAEIGQTGLADDARELDARAVGSGHAAQRLGDGAGHFRTGIGSAGFGIHGRGEMVSLRRKSRV